MTARAFDRRITIDIAEPCAEWRKAVRGCRAICQAAGKAALAAAAPGLLPGPAGIEFSIVLGDDAMLRRLNAKWRGKDAPTNVLSFPAQEGVIAMPQAGAPLPLGDVVLAFGTVAAEAAAQGKALADHLAHLVVHGVLHLLGFDHVTAAAAGRMEGLETVVLAGLGVADPYQHSPPRARVRHG